VGLGWLVRACSSHSIRPAGGGDGSSHSTHKAKEVGSQSTHGVNCGHNGGQYLGCKVTILQPNMVGHEGGHVALCTRIDWALIKLGSSTQLCCVGSRQ
jgi:hypothetical protein